MALQTLEAFRRGDGAHCGLTDWYEDKEVALKAALAAHAPFDTGWYRSKKEIANARIWSDDGVKIKVEASVSDNLDTEGLGFRSVEVWTLDAIAAAVIDAWASAEEEQEESAPYDGFSVLRHGAKGARWVETYLLSDGTFDAPPGDYYCWWGWQHDKENEVGVPDPDIPKPAVAAFENWAQRWVWGQTNEKSLRIGAWEIKPWRDAPHAYEDPSDYVGMGWVDSRGRP